MAALAARGAAAGAQELCLADTIGVGVPSQVRDLAARVRDAVGAQPPLRFHFHNTRNTGFANAVAAVELGARVLDASAGGIGGCPFAPRATGNIATDDLVSCWSGWAWTPATTWRRCCRRPPSSAPSSATRSRRCCPGPAPSPSSEGLGRRQPFRLRPAKRGVEVS